MNRFPDFVSLDSFYIGMRGVFQTHFVLEKAEPVQDLTLGVSFNHLKK